MTTTKLAAPPVAPDPATQTFTAPSASEPGVTRVMWLADGPGDRLSIRCTCPAGAWARPDRRPIPCRHARALVDLLMSWGTIVPTTGGWRVVADFWSDLANAGQSPPLDAREAAVLDAMLAVQS